MISCNRAHRSSDVKRRSNRGSRISWWRLTEGDALRMARNWRRNCWTSIVGRISLARLGNFPKASADQIHGSIFLLELALDVALKGAETIFTSAELADFIDTIARIGFRFSTVSLWILNYPKYPAISEEEFLNFSICQFLGTPSPWIHFIHIHNN